MTARIPVGLIAVGLVAIAAGVRGAAARGQRADEGAAPGAIASKPTPAIVGSTNCSSCHAHPENYTREIAENTLICRMVEYPIWKVKDHHQMAYQVLLGDRSKEMGKLLGIDVTDTKNSCVQCHGIVAPPEVRPFQFKAETDGVTCVACHGAAEEWLKDHQFPNDPRWRSLTRDEKWRREGMRDLWDPRTRVETCLSCHIGSFRENKILTHAMYAAGHPPLPSIEVAAFSEEQPRHWQYLREKPAAIQQHLGFNPARLEQTELVAVSGLVSLRTTIKHLIDSKPDEAAGRAPTLDFARFDCVACHHELRTWDRSWRQARMEGHSPGRPTPPAWPRALVRLGLEAADPARATTWFAALNERMKAFDVAMTSRPFGDIEKSRPIAQQILRLLDEPLNALGEQARVKPNGTGRVIDRREALRLLHRIGPIASELVHDYESARQIAWAFRTIYWEFEQDPTKRDPRIVELLSKLDRKLGLTLNEDESKERRPVLEMLGARLKAVSDYEPVEFRKDIESLVHQLPRK